jgi:membrane-associated phospholipid phosphatase
LKGSKSLESFFKVLTQFGTQPVLIPLLVICLLFLSLQKSYCFTSVLVYSVFFDNIFKIFYGNPRPFWVDTTLSKSCDGGFGNPSGHSFSSSSIYLTLWHLFTDFPFFKDTLYGIIIRVLLLILAITLIVGIMLTRIFLGVHGVNQVIYGASLGVALYYIVFHVFSLHKWSTEDFFSLFKTAFYRIFFSLWFATLIIAGVVVWKFRINDTSQWVNALNSFCPDIKEFRKFNNDGLFGMLVLFVLIGCHYGIMFLIHMIDKNYGDRSDELNNWYRSSTLMKHLNRLLIMVLFALPLILVLVVPSSSSLTVIYIFKVSVPYLLTVFGFYGPSIFLSIKWNCANDKIIYYSPKFDLEAQSNVFK